MEFEEVIECQTCGDVLRKLTPSEAKRISENPYNYIFDCGRCYKDIIQNLSDEGK